MRLLRLTALFCAVSAQDRWGQDTEEGAGLEAGDADGDALDAADADLDTGDELELDSGDGPAFENGDDELTVADDDEVVRPGDNNYDFELFEGDANSEDILT